MKKTLLISGLCLFSTVSFSQLVSGSRNAVITPEETKAQPESQQVDTVVVHSVGKTSKPVIQTEITRENQPANKASEKPVNTSSAKKQ